jgi:hypothetical protein
MPCDVGVIQDPWHGKLKFGVFEKTISILKMSLAAMGRMAAVGEIR